ncbi:MAG: LPS assembly lipoprotein LptE [Phycisphaerales bacterium]|nr:LPS assembly lipoprotein LptE [Phycisphaerales bacterium]
MLFRYECCKVFTGRYCIVLYLSISSLLFGCGVYSFRDASIPPNITTIKIDYFENKASYVNPSLAPALVDKFQQKIAQQTKLTRTNSEDAQYQVSGYITQYYVTTVGVSNQQAVSNRLTVAVHIIFDNLVDDKTNEFDVTRNYDFSSSLSLQQAEPGLLQEMVSNLSDDIFNRIFSNW